MEILLVYVVLAVLFVVSTLFVWKINTKRKLCIVNGFAIGIGFVLIIFSEKDASSILFFLLFVIWAILGMVIYILTPTISECFEKILCKITGQQFEQMKDDSLDDHTPEKTISLRYYIIAIILYVLFLLAIFPQIL